MHTICIKNATVYDGTGAPAFTADVSCVDGKLHLGAVDGAQKVLDGTGLCLAPGFIDTHSHGDSCLGNPHNSLSRVSQGITTQLAGNCGHTVVVLNEEMYREDKPDLTPSPGLDGPEHFTGFGPYLAYANSLPQVENTAFLVGHGNLRRVAMGFDDREPTAGELAHMKAMLTEAMENGAFGMSSGLIYIPGAYSRIDEMAELCKIVAQYDGIYATHMRNESEGILDSIREAIEVARRSGCRLNISHLKVCGRQNHGVAEQMLALIHDARKEGLRVSADQYPYEASSTSLSSCVPPKYFTQGTEGLVKILRDPAMRRQIRDEIENDTVADFENLVLGCGGFGGIVVSAAPQTPAAVGKTIAAYAQECGADEYEVFFDLLEANGDGAWAIYFDIGEPDLMKILADPTIMVGTDGVITTADGLCHPRAFGTFTRALGRYGRDKGLLPLEAMLHKMTGLPARTLGLARKGVIAEGMDADLVLFNPQTVCDRADFADPHQLSDGIEAVIIGGEVVYSAGALTGKTPGRVILRGQG